MTRKADPLKLRDPDTRLATREWRSGGFDRLGRAPYPNRCAMCASRARNAVASAPSERPGRRCGGVVGVSRIKRSAGVISGHANRAAVGEERIGEPTFELTAAAGLDADKHSRRRSSELRQ